jgi:hypothetical protein
MPGRSSSSGRSSSFSRSSSSRSSVSRPSYSYSSPKSPVSAPAPYTPPSSVVQHNYQVQQPGFFSNMWQGFGLGAGQSIAMNIFRSDPKVTHVHENAPSTSTTSVQSTSTSETFYSKEFTQCMKDKWDDKETCKQYIQCLKDNKDDKSLCKNYM